MIWTRDLLLALSITGSLYYILSTLALARLFRHKVSGEATAVLPKVSLLKPVSGIDRDAAANFASYLNQDYPDYEVLFGVLDPKDPATNVIERTVESCERASLFVGSTIEGANNKVRILHELGRHARGDIIVITDADTRAAPCFLREIVSPFADCSVGVVTCLYRGVDAGTSADVLESLQMTCLFAPGVACAQSLGSMDFALGAAIAVRANVLQKIGGFGPLADYLADDFQLGHRPSELGYEIKISRYVMDEVLGGESLWSVLARELRWSKTTRISRPLGHFGLILTFGVANAGLFAAASKASTAGLALLAAVLILRVLTAAIGSRVLGQRLSGRQILLLPIRDMLSFGLWIASYWGSTVTWRGRRLRVRADGKIAEH